MITHPLTDWKPPVEKPAGLKRNIRHVLRLNVHPDLHLQHTIIVFDMFVQPDSTRNPLITMLDFRLQYALTDGHISCLAGPSLGAPSELTINNTDKVIEIDGSRLGDIVIIEAVGTEEGTIEGDVARRVNERHFRHWFGGSNGFGI
jgi:hypothetical protein